MEIVVPTSVAGADDVAALIAESVEAAHAGVQIQAGEVVFWVPGDQADEALSRTRAVVSPMAASGLPVDAQGVFVRAAAPESEWRDAWKSHFHVARLTRQIVVVPSWEQYAAKPGDRVIDLEPGQAFGTGLHASTRLILAEIQTLADAGLAVSRFLDVGTGSGILAIAAAKLWPSSLGDAVDIDPLAITASRANAENNGVGDRITCLESIPNGGPGGHQLVMANIQADVLVELRSIIASKIAPGGVLVLSGLLVGQVESVAASYTADTVLSLDAIRHSDDDPEWGSARLRYVA